MRLLSDSAYTFDAKKDRAFAIVDFHVDDTAAFLVRSVDGAHRYVMAAAGREHEGLTLATTFEEYLRLALANIGFSCVPGIS